MVEGNIPRHVAIIMDGNRRWARSRGVDYRFGHKEGAKTLENTVRYAKKVGIKYITVFAFSTENWKRSQEEVGALMLLLKTYLDDYGKRADTENIKIKVLGDISAFSNGLQKSINNAIERTKDNDGITFSIALNYGGRDEIVHAIKHIANDINNGKLTIDEIVSKEYIKIIAPQIITTYIAYSFLYSLSIIVIINAINPIPIIFIISIYKLNTVLTVSNSVLISFTTIVSTITIPASDVIIAWSSLPALLSIWCKTAIKIPTPAIFNNKSIFIYPPKLN